MQAPIIAKVDINGAAIMSISFTGPLNSTELRQKVEDDIEPLFTAVSGVASVDIFGGTTRQISIELERTRCSTVTWISRPSWVSSGNRT